MKFHIAVVQCNGQVTDRGARSSARVLAISAARRLVTGFGLMLDEQLPQLRHGVVAASVPLFDGRALLEWRLPVPFAATAAFCLAGRLKFTWFLFSGHEPPPTPSRCGPARTASTAWWKKPG